MRAGPRPPPAREQPLEEQGNPHFPGNSRPEARLAPFAGSLACRLEAPSQGGLFPLWRRTGAHAEGPEQAIAGLLH